MEGGGVSDEQEYFEHMADLALVGMDTLAALDHDRFRRQIIVALKEVERECRHAAADRASKLSNELRNMRPPY